PVIDFLLRASTNHQEEPPPAPSVLRPRRRRSSPTRGGSTSITSAPNSPKNVAQSGAARYVARSSTVTPASLAGESGTRSSYPPRARIRAGRDDESDAGARVGRAVDARVRGRADAPAASGRGRHRRPRDRLHLSRHPPRAG